MERETGRLAPQSPERKILFLALSGGIASVLGNDLYTKNSQTTSSLLAALTILNLKTPSCLPMVSRDKIIDRRKKT